MQQQQQKHTHLLDIFDHSYFHSFIQWRHETNTRRMVHFLPFFFVTFLSISPSQPIFAIPFQWILHYYQHWKEVIQSLLNSYFWFFFLPVFNLFPPFFVYLFFRFLFFSYTFCVPWFELFSQFFFFTQTYTQTHSQITWHHLYTWQMRHVSINAIKVQNTRRGST